MPKPAEHHIIVLDATTGDTRDHYGIIFRSRNVFDTTKSHSPTRLDVWCNVNRPNPYKGKQLGDKVRDQVVTSYFINKPGANPLTAQWLDPQNEPTDDPVTLLLSTESSAICADTRFNTGQPASGQVYAVNTRLGEGDTATLVYPDGTRREVMLHFTHNGHGYALFRD